MDLPCKSRNGEPPINAKSNISKRKLKSKTRRGYGRKNAKNILKNKIHQLIVLGTNAAGLNKKKESLFHLINMIQPAIVTIQETKFTRRRSLKLPGFETFEHVRSDKSGGGLLTAIHSDLDPVLVYDDVEIELIVVQISVNNIKIRVFNAYGPQEALLC